MESIYVCRSGDKPSLAQLLEPKEGSAYGIMAPFNPQVHPPAFHQYPLRPAATARTCRLIELATD
jgi:hypothetical protein